MVGEARFIDPEYLRMFATASCSTTPTLMTFNGRQFLRGFGLNAPYSFNLELPSTELATLSIKSRFSMGSYHPGGLHLLQCDGAVRFVNEAMDDEVRRKLGSRNGREVIAADEL